MANEPPARRDLVVIGASAGGVEVLRQIVADLPGDFPAAICVVLHIAPESPSALAPILARAGRLPCRPAVDGEALRPGQILVAPPDRHLVIEDGVVKLTLGPRENGHRPAVDTLFRSAADAHGVGVVGVILSGTRDDGVAGLAAIKAHGGAALVQDPGDALYAGMPTNALTHVAVDFIAPSTAIGGTLTAMVNAVDPPPGTDPPEPPISSAPEAEQIATICPECRGVLTERVTGGLTQWKCRVGHRYSPDSLADAQAEDVEASLWAAVRALEDRERLLNRLAARSEAHGQPRSGRSFRNRAAAAGEHAQTVRRALTAAAATALRMIEAETDEAPGEQDVA